MAYVFRKVITIAKTSVVQEYLPQVSVSQERNDELSQVTSDNNIEKFLCNFFNIQSIKNSTQIES